MRIYLKMYSRLCSLSMEINGCDLGPYPTISDLFEGVTEESYSVNKIARFDLCTRAHICAFSCSCAVGSVSVARRLFAGNGLGKIIVKSC